MYNKTNRFFSLIFLFAFIFSCDKKEECIIIEDKYESNGTYYFYFLNNQINQPFSNNNSSLDVDPLGTGKVSKEEFENYNVGDKYCY
tara:strand:+ start:92 stop:352 length:261 start_codon:yes stop_codon:yes gene_type:complete